AALDERRQIAEQTDALGHRQRLGGEQLAEQVALVVDAVVAELAIVREHPRRTRRSLQGELALLLAEQRTRAGLAFRDGIAHAHGDLPRLVRLGLAADRPVALLREQQLRRLAVALQLGGE